MRVHQILHSEGKTEIKLADIQPGDLLKLSNQYNSHVSGLIYKLNQVTDYNWMNFETLMKCVERLGKVISVNAEVERGMVLTMMGRKVVGFVDVIDDGVLWELKCVGELTKEHILQLAIYAFMYECMDRGVRPLKYNLFNILTGEIIRITSTHEQLQAMMKMLICAKYHSAGVKSDAEFFQLVEERRGKYKTGAVNVKVEERPCALCEHFKDIPITCEEKQMIGKKAAKKPRERKFVKPRFYRKA
jgi:hypothetical protein